MNARRHPLAVLLSLVLLGMIAVVPAISGSRLDRSAQDKEKTHPIDRQLDACMEKAGSTASMVACLATAQKAWDARMNADYRKLLAKLPTKGQAELKEAQRAWIVFRDREYKAISAVYGTRQGTMYIPMASDSAMNRTRDRALQIKDLLDVFDIDP